MTVAHRAAVCGKPIAHSLSPVVHSAGYAAGGLFDWAYSAIECAAAELPDLVRGLGDQWAGLSLTMPLKEAGLAVADVATPAATAIGAANTLVHRPDGSWLADNTDAPGILRVLTDAGLGDHPSITVLGGGGTARAALAAAASLGAPVVDVVIRRASALAELEPVAAAVGITVRGVSWEALAGGAPAGGADAIISTVPKGAADGLAGALPWRAGTVLFDAIYDPWPTPLAAAATERGVRVVSGLDLLLAQALGQFEQFTGVRPAPEAAMRAALTAAARVR